MLGHYVREVPVGLLDQTLNEELCLLGRLC